MGRWVRLGRGGSCRGRGMEGGSWDDAGGWRVIQRDITIKTQVYRVLSLQSQGGYV
jgi:hypothetical protein